MSKIISTHFQDVKHLLTTDQRVYFDNFNRGRGKGQYYGRRNGGKQGYSRENGKRQGYGIGNGSCRRN